MIVAPVTQVLSSASQHLDVLGTEVAVERPADRDRAHPAAGPPDRLASSGSIAPSRDCKRKRPRRLTSQGQDTGGRAGEQVRSADDQAATGEPANPADGTTRRARPGGSTRGGPAPSA